MQLKNYYDKKLAQLLAEKIQKVYPAFNANSFIKNVVKQIEPLELKERIKVMAQELKIHLPDSYKESIDIIRQIMGPELQTETGMFTHGYWLSPIAYFIEKYGTDHFTISTRAIKELTKRHTGEYAIRPYIEKYPEKTMTLLEKWSKDKNVHVRRLSSEGCRPRLPWHKKLDLFIKDPRPIFPILENLKNDESKFVQKSVANNLADILKDNYNVGIKIIKKWSMSKNENTKWIIKHALRNERKRVIK